MLSKELSKTTHKHFQDFHIMRDHPLHIQPIMGGMWGLKLTQNRTKYHLLFEEMLNSPEHSLAPRKERNHDQALLEQVIWPVVRNKDALTHDSYTCQKYWNAQPWPTQRLKNESNFVGAVISKHQKVPKACPKQCRPYDHPNWTFC